MNQVPVLDQGRHGTCTTFAVTAAIDAVLNKGDYISQLCLLQLGNSLEKSGYLPSGWEGSFGETILNELRFFGIVSKQQQRAIGCGGLSDYPTNEKDHPLTEMSPLEYHQNSESLLNLVGWSSVVDKFRYTDKITNKDILTNIKKTLDNKNRLTLGVILVDLNLGTVGAVGKNHTTNDSWVLTTKIKKDIIDFINGKNPDLLIGGHAMIITGYDDDGMAIDDQGNRHWGLFTLRNSWGDKAGDNGDFYMSYDYLSTLIIEAHRIRAL
jgi:hypothetical protein